MESGKINLFCFSHAGGSALVYDRWKKYLHSSINLIPVELAGRGRRFGEPFYMGIDEAIADIYFQLKDRLNEGNFSFWGHSMGAILAFEVLCKCKQLMNYEPVHIFFSGSNPPHIMKVESISNLPDSDFLEKILLYGGIHKGILQNEKLLNIALSILREDFKVIESYTHKNIGMRFECDISIFSGKQDIGVLRQDLTQWTKYTHGGCSIYEFEGGHFFLNDYDREITNIINSKLRLID